ncbi:nuclear transport factor 2 family protein [Spongiibacter taiwanensis]|uniref:nuclear transport factor 2 family protein n=1 Tax=Spongiibacter taiwanensis TaxID=1748242 RepID=UPI00203504E0|nr:nuclear transport factor 2 family protein [Spongiibacter taiwanensis]USA42652.1 nuclear transport factor 2 family protein [Spongiibacter taiwanensis]
MADSTADTRAACEALIFNFAYHIDHHEFDLAIDQFANDAVFERPDGALSGHGEMRSFWSGRSPNHVTRHLCHRPHFLETSTGTARAVTQVTLYQAEKAEGAPIAQVAGPMGIVEFHDTFVRGASGWKIAHRKAVPVLIYTK